MTLPQRTGTEVSATLEQQVYDSLRAELMGGRFLPGEKLSLRKVAVANGVSPMPAREAFKRLLSEGALQLLPNRTITVPRLFIEDFRHLMRVRAMIEGVRRRTRCQRDFVARNREPGEKKFFALAGICRIRSRPSDAAEHGIPSGPLRLVQLGRADSHDSRIMDANGTDHPSGTGTATVQWSASEHKVALSALQQRDGKGVRRAIERDILATVSALEKTGVFTSRR